MLVEDRTRREQLYNTGGQWQVEGTAQKKAESIKRPEPYCVTTRERSTVQVTLRKKSADVASKL